MVIYGVKKLPTHLSESEKNSNYFSLSNFGKKSRRTQTQRKTKFIHIRKK
jgi:hypothetical protein